MVTSGIRCRRFVVELVTLSPHQWHWRMLIGLWYLYSSNGCLASFGMYDIVFSRISAISHAKSTIALTVLTLAQYRYFQWKRYEDKLSLWYKLELILIMKRSIFNVQSKTIGLWSEDEEPKHNAEFKQAKTLTSSLHNYVCVILKILSAMQRLNTNIIDELVFDLSLNQASNY